MWICAGSAVAEVDATHTMGEVVISAASFEENIKQALASITIVSRDQFEHDGVSEGSTTKLPSAAIRRLPGVRIYTRRKKLSTSARKNAHERPIFALQTSAFSQSQNYAAAGEQHCRNLVHIHCVRQRHLVSAVSRAGHQLSPAARSIRFNRQSCFTGLLRLKSRG